jgi:hypothetical protein
LCDARLMTRDYRPGRHADNELRRTPDANGGTPASANVRRMSEGSAGMRY